MRREQCSTALAMIMVLTLPIVPGLSNSAFADDTTLASPSEATVVDARTLRDLTSKALDGSAAASEIVAGHYETVGSMQDIEYWTRVGAENGSALLMRSYALLLLNGVKKGDERRCRRSMFWYERARRIATEPELRKSLRSGRAEHINRVRDCLG